MKGFKQHDGFTLVELMVVVLIIGVLVAVAVPVFKAAKADAARNTCQANQRTILGVFQAAIAARGQDDLPIEAWYGKTELQPSTPLGQMLIPELLKSEPHCPLVVPGTYGPNGGRNCYRYTRKNGAIHILGERDRIQGPGDWAAGWWEDYSHRPPDYPGY